MKKIFKLKTDNIIVGLLVFVTLVAGGMLASIGVKADSDNTTVVDEITIMIPVACSMSSTVTSVHTDTVTAASYNEDIGVTDLKATCNDFDGFSIYAVGFTDDTEGMTTMKGASSDLTISTGTATSGDTSNWAMKLTAVTDPSVTYNPSNLSVVNGFGSYSAIPANFTKVVEYKDSGDGSSATDQTLGAHVQTTYAAYVSAAQAADTYTGQVKYVLVHPASVVAGRYTIAYNANGSSSGAMTSETNIPNYEPHTLVANTYSAPTGYIFAGWCTVQDQTASGVVQNAAPQTTCTGDSYADQGTIPASPSPTATNNGTFTLYAYWKRAMQGVSVWKSALNIGDEVTATDIRDAKTYTVAKLADNNVWMTQNLAHDIGSISGGTYTPADTDIPSSWTPNENNGEYTKQASDMTWSYSNTTPESYNPGTLYWNGIVMDQTNCEANGGTWMPWGECQGASTTSITGNSHYLLGNYYNWTAAVAMSDSSSYTADNDDANQSICPAGWMLPKSGTTLTGSGSFLYLKNQANLTAGVGGNISLNPSWFVYGGIWSGTLGTVGSEGFYWSSVGYGGGISYRLRLSNGAVSPQGSGNRYEGISVRCVAR